MWDGREEAGKWSSAVEPLRRLNALRWVNGLMAIFFAVRFARTDGVQAAAIAIALAALVVALFTVVKRRRDRSPRGHSLRS